MYGKVQECRNGNHTVLSAQSLRSGESLCILADCQLS